MKKLLPLVLLVALAFGVVAAPGEATARPRRRPAPQTLVVALEAQQPRKATWTAVQPVGPDRPVFYYRGQFWTFSERGWLAMPTRWSQWQRMRHVPKALRVMPLYRKAPVTNMAALICPVAPPQ